jgi:hypothetical protein
VKHVGYFPENLGHFVRKTGTLQEKPGTLPVFFLRKIREVSRLSIGSPASHVSRSFRFFIAS